MRCVRQWWWWRRQTAIDSVLIPSAILALYAWLFYVSWWIACAFIPWADQFLPEVFVLLTVILAVFGVFYLVPTYCEDRLRVFGALIRHI